MTSRVIRNGVGTEHPGSLKEIIVSCDHMSCTKSMNDTAIKDGGGLKEMGWEAVCQNGVMRHYCPEHNRSLQGVTR